MIDQDTHFATPEFRNACEPLDKCAQAILQVPPFTSLQQAARRTILRSVPQDLEHTCIALFDELEFVIRELRKSNEYMEKDLVVVQRAEEENAHNRVMRKKLCEFLKTVAFLVDEKFDPVTLPYPDREFKTDRIICKLYRLLAPGNIKSWDVSNETPVGSVSPEPQSAAWFRAQRQAAPEESEGIVAGKIWTAEDHNKAVATMKGVPIPVTDEDLAGVDYEELKELRFQNAELSRQLEAAKSQSYVPDCSVDASHLTGNFDAQAWADVFVKVFPRFDHGTALAWFANAIMAGFDHAQNSTASGQKRDLERVIEGCRESLADFCTREELDPEVPIHEIVLALVHWHRGALVKIGNLETDVQSVQLERDELTELVSDIKVVLAKHLSDDPLFNVVPIAEIIDQKLAHLQAVSQEAHRLQMQEAKITLQAIRLSDAGIVSQVGADLAGMVQNLVAFRLGAVAAENAQTASVAPAPVEQDDDGDIQLPATPNVIPPSHEEFLRGCGILALTKGKRHCIPKFLGLRYGQNAANAHECMRQLNLSGTEWANFRNTGERIVTYCADKNLVTGTKEREDFDKVLAEFCDQADTMDGVKPAKREPKDF